jgi:hypothetical protein
MAFTTLALFAGATTPPDRRFTHLLLEQKWAARQEGKMALSRNNPGNSTSNKQVFVNQRAAPTWDGFMSRTFKGILRNVIEEKYDSVD